MKQRYVEVESVDSQPLRRDAHASAAVQQDSSFFKSLVFKVSAISSCAVIGGGHGVVALEDLAKRDYASAVAHGAVALAGIYASIRTAVHVADNYGPRKE